MTENTGTTEPEETVLGDGAAGDVQKPGQPAPKETVYQADAQPASPEPERDADSLRVEHEVEEDK